MTKSKFETISSSVILASAIIVGGRFIGAYCFLEIDSNQMRIMVGMLIVIAIFFMLLPFIAFVMCLVTNRITLTKYKNGIEGKPPKK